MLSAFATLQKDSAYLQASQSYLYNTTGFIYTLKWFPGSQSVKTEKVKLKSNILGNEKTTKNTVFLQTESLGAR